MTSEQDQSIPDIYADRVRLTVSVFGVSLTFGLSEPHPSADEPEYQPKVSEKVHIRMSLEHATVMAMLLAKQLRIYQEKTGTKIPIPPDVMKGLGIEETS